MFCPVRRIALFVFSFLFLNSVYAATVIYTDEFAPAPILMTPSTGPDTAFIPANPGLRMDTADQNWNVFGGLGYVWHSDGTGGSEFKVTSIETDQLSDSTGNSHLQYLIGLQRVFLHRNTVIQRFGIGPTVFIDPVTFSGQVFQFQDSSLANFDYNIRAEPINIDLEAQLLFKRFGKRNKVGVAPYALAGAGVSFVTLDYNETAICDTPSTTIFSFSSSAVRPVLLLGLGLQFDVLFRFFIRTDYRYLYRGDAELGSIKVNLNTQSINVLFGYRFA